VHRDLLKEDGPVFRGVRPEAEAKCEFISSRDAAFRPTGLVNGPDGALYLIDMQRDVIEHPDYIPPRMREKSDLRAGEDRGRIYRITPAKSQLPKPAGLANPAAALESAIPWERETAHRMLACLTGDAAAAALPQVSGIAQNSAIPEGRVRALWVLDAWQKLDAAMLDAALRHQHPGVRENAVELAMRKAAAWPKETSALLLRAAADEHPRVRFLAALALSGVNDPEKIGALEKVWKKDRQSEWTRKAVVIGAGAQAPILAARVKDADTGLARAAAAFAEAPEVLDSLTFSAECLDGLAEGVRLSNRGASADKWQPVAEKIAQGLKSDTVPAFVRFVKAAGVKPPGALQKFQTQAAAVLSGKSAGDRRQATEIVAAMEDFPRLLDLLGDHETAEIQQLAVNTLAKARDPALGAAIVARWRSVKPAVRPAIVRMLVDRRSWHSALLDALEKEQIRPAELNLDLEQRRELLRWSGPETAKRAAKFFTDNEYSNRKELVDKLLADLPAEGSLREGNELYRQRCLMCHVHGRLGNPVGPDLTSVSHRSAEDLLTHIVDPNQAINPTYATCEVITQRGEKHYGILREEKPDVVILIKPLAMREVIPRKDIKSFRTIDKSLMPEGLESGMSPFDLRSLIEFLKSGN
jgi:putative heme-binding domain-containing protein